MRKSLQFVVVLTGVVSAYLYFSQQRSCVMASENGDAHRGVKDLVICCSDHRLVKFHFNWIRDNFNYDVDPIMWPGAAKILTNEAACKQSLEGVFTLRKLHGFENVHIINHIDCGAYGGSKRFADEKAEIEFLTAELQRAERIITGRYEGRGLKVKLYIMRLDGTLIDVQPLHDDSAHASEPQHIQVRPEVAATIFPRRK